MKALGLAVLCVFLCLSVAIPTAGSASPASVNVAPTTVPNTAVLATSGTYPAWDINQDGKVNYRDLAILGAHWGETASAPYPAWDINQDGKTDYKDLAILAAHYGETF